MDAGCPGLGLRLRAGGGRRYVCLVGGRYRTIGDPALMPLEDARAACRRMHAEPDGAKPDCLSFAGFIDGDWRAQYLARQKPRSRIRCEVALRTQLMPAFGARRLDAISRADCLAWFDRYSATAPGGIQGGDGVSGEPAISPTGEAIAFTSEATNLVGDDTNGLRDVFFESESKPVILRHGVGAIDATLTTDGTAAITSDGNGAPRLWNSTDGAEVSNVFAGIREDIMCERTEC